MGKRVSSVNFLVTDIRRSKNTARFGDSVFEDGFVCFYISL